MAAGIGSRYGRSEQSGAIGTGDESLLPDVVQGMIDHGRARVSVLRYGVCWCGITFPEDRERVRRCIASLVERGDHPVWLWG
jgi:hypothetical protein